jgi:hypothetical protein
MPTDDPSRAGLMNTGKPNGLSKPFKSRTVTLSVTGMPLSLSTDLKRSLSMQSAEAMTPAPT